MYRKNLLLWASIPFFILVQSASSAETVWQFQRRTESATKNVYSMTFPKVPAGSVLKLLFYSCRIDHKNPATNNFTLQRILLRTTKATAATIELAIGAFSYTNSSGDENAEVDSGTITYYAAAGENPVLEVHQESTTSTEIITCTLVGSLSPAS